MGKSGCYSGWCKNDDRGMWLLWKYAGNIWEKKWMKQLLKLPLHCSTKYFNVKSECCKPSTKIWHMKNQKEKKTLSRIIWCNFLVDWCCLYIKSEGVFFVFIPATQYQPHLGPALLTGHDANFTVFHVCCCALVYRWIFFTSSLCR